LDSDQLQRLAELIRKQPDATLEQLREQGGFRCSLTTLWRALRRLGLTRKKKTLHADERDRPDVQKKRRSFRRKVKPIDPRRLIFVDETGVTTAMTPAYAWSPRGERANASAPGAWESVTVIAALGLDGVRAPLMFPGSTDAATFESYIEQVLVPTLHEGDVVVFDNLSAHLGTAVAEAIEGAGARVLPLPPYSPDYTPIEEMFSKVKEFLRRVAARAKGDLYNAIGDALREVTDPDIIGWFRNAGLYAAHG
jgi:transposase